MKSAVIGSCLSNLTAARLSADFGVEQTLCVHHNRSDSFVKYFIDRSAKMIDMEFLDNFLVDTDQFRVEARRFLENQQPDTVGYFQLQDRRREGVDVFAELAEEPLDIILIDNFMDISAKLMQSTRPEWANSPLFLNPGFYGNPDEIVENFKFTEFLTAKESAENQNRIVQFIRQLQPKAKIFFLCFQYSTSEESPERMARAHAFYDEFKKVVAPDIYLIPPLDLPADLQMPGDWTHFENPRVYKAIAGYIFLTTQANLPRIGDDYRIPPCPGDETHLVEHPPFERQTAVAGAAVVGGKGSAGHIGLRSIVRRVKRALVSTLAKR